MRHHHCQLVAILNYHREGIAAIVAVMVIALIIPRFFFALSRRAKLFIFGETLLNKGTGQKEWVERGIGEVKFLQ